MSEQRRPCDLVMKGGVTSGIVYPSAIYEISRAFDLKSIGGTSAGAIAAALAAAAQYRRLRRDGTPEAEAGYDRLAQVPDWLGANGHLLGLFAPNKATRRLFRCIAGFVLPGPSWPAKLARIPLDYALAAAIGAAPGAFGVLAATQLHLRGAVIAHVVVSLIVALAGALACSVVAMGIELFRVLPKNGFGLVTGIDDSRNNPDSLCSWLTRELERTAGLSPGFAPLTFAMLWDPAAGLNVPGAEELAGERAIDLQMMTTSLTEGRPYNLPCKLDRYYFKSSEMRRYFPTHVVDWMEKKARPGARPFKDFHALPPIGDLPVIVATRLSLSFPLLLSAVPLYAVDYADDPSGPLQPVWFSDGGLASNFPVALFDAPLPQRPTLAINLGSTTDERRGEPAPGADAGIIRYAGSNLSGRLGPFTTIRGLGSFFGAIFATMQNWSDNTLSELPGFRDRIVTVELRPDEGGLHLNMDKRQVEDLKQRGTRAGLFLVERFAAPSTLEPGTGMSWENHRWLRYRTTMAAIRAYLNDFDDAYSHPVAPDATYEELILSSDPKARPHTTYPFPDDAEVRRRIAALTLALDGLAHALEREDAIAEHAPRPLPELTLRPRLNA
jgi:predicted acylesterase/phospholipase RssA